MLTGALVAETACGTAVLRAVRIYDGKPAHRSTPNKLCLPCEGNFPMGGGSHCALEGGTGTGTTQLRMHADRTGKNSGCLEPMRFIITRRIYKEQQALPPPPPAERPGGGPSGRTIPPVID